jgi:hypothetical protein
MPTIVMNYEGNQLNAKYLVDYNSGSPVARAVEELPPDLAQKYAAAEKQFHELSDDIKQQETKLKAWLKDAFKKVQQELIAQRSKMLRTKHKFNEQRSRAENEAATARVISAMAVGQGAGF